MPIFDQGYQHWKGTLSGHAWRWLAISRHGLRNQFKSRIVRMVLLLAWLPALALVIAMALWGLFEQGSEGVMQLLKPIFPPGVAADPHAYRHAVWTIAYSIFFKFEIFFIMLLMVIAGPNLISRDLRFSALPLYFSRPLTRLDYFLGKLGIIAGLVAVVAVVPAAVAYILGICFSLDLGMIRDTWRLLPASMGYGLLIVASAGTLVLALSSLSRRSLYVGIAWGGFWLISSAIAGVLGGIQVGTLYHRIRKEESAKVDAKAGQPANPDQMPPSPDPRRGGHSTATWQRVQSRVEQAQVEAAPTNWRPLFSYTANLERVGEALLNTDAAWVEIGRAVKMPQNVFQKFMGGLAASPASERRLANRMVPQYPWIWSAGVLAGLWGLSLWTLIMRVKSLDRLG